MKQIDELIQLTADKLGLKRERVDKVVKEFFNSIRTNIENEETPFFSIPNFGKLYYRYYKKVSLKEKREGIKKHIIE